MTSLNKNRIESIDLLKGLVMVIMALDHTRDYFHASAFLFNPTDPTQTSWPIFLTRWITHYCAPAFCFLAGLSAFFVGKRKTASELSGFLLKRGLWLVFIEFTIVNFGWYFDIYFSNFDFLVIWSLGISMIVLAGLIHLPRTIILIFSCVLIFGHHLLDKIHFDGSLLWGVFHEAHIYSFPNGLHVYTDYPIIPWIAVMSLGYYFGTFYDQSFDQARRKKLMNIIGLSAIVLFIVLNWSNLYGDPDGWMKYDTLSKTMMSFLDPQKYPPSLLYLLMTLGPSLLFLANVENVKGSVVNVFSMFGRVPFFFYILHIFLIHLVALVAAEATGFGWQKMILSNWLTEVPELKGYGFSLWAVYLIWVGVIVALYPLCKRFDVYKLNHKEKWWLSYL
ncbi:MAG: DUF1624 domain-containing protein [Bacteroidia bacterium]|nr:DUF1624 domain-containing protein [Bacteroidia bacterium]